MQKQTCLLDDQYSSKKDIVLFHIFSSSSNITITLQPIEQIPFAKSFSSNIQTPLFPTHLTNPTRIILQFHWFWNPEENQFFLSQMRKKSQDLESHFVQIAKYRIMYQG